MRNKKYFIVILAVCVLAVVLAGCCLSHDWTEAGCEAPKTCAKCGQIEGDALGHSWAEAVCEAPETCTNCGETRGEALGHDWQEATCETPRTCTNCGWTEGEALGHEIDYSDQNFPAKLQHEGDKIKSTGFCGKCGKKGSVIYHTEEQAALKLALAKEERHLGFLSNGNRKISKETLAGEYGEQAVADSKLVLREDGTMSFNCLGVGGTGYWSYVGFDEEGQTFEFSLNWTNEEGEENWTSLHISPSYTMVLVEVIVAFYEGPEQGAGESAEALTNCSAAEDGAGVHEIDYSDPDIYGVLESVGEKIKATGVCKNCKGKGAVIYDTQKAAILAIAEQRRCLYAVNDFVNRSVLSNEELKEIYSQQEIQDSYVQIKEDGTLLFSFDGIAFEGATDFENGMIFMDDYDCFNFGAMGKSEDGEKMAVQGVLYTYKTDIVYTCVIPEVDSAEAYYRFVFR